jgi:hypothetical protein
MSPVHFIQLIDRMSLILIAAIAGLAGAAPCFAADKQLAAQEETSWRSRLVCGRNSLYLFLKSHGHRVDYAELRRAIPLGDLGSSFGDLHRAAQRFGAAVEIWHASLDRLAAVDLPAIVLLESARAPSGHFVLLVDVDDANVLITDPTSTSSVRMPRAQFLRSYSGFAMIHHSTPRPRTAWGMAAILLGGVLVAPTVWRWRRTAAAATAVLFLMTLGGCDAARVEARAHHSHTSKTAARAQMPSGKRPLPLVYYGGLRFDDLSRAQYDDAVRRCRMASTMSVSNLLHMVRLRDIDRAPDGNDKFDRALNTVEVLKRVLNYPAFDQAYGGLPFLIATPHGARFSETAWDPAAVDKRTREAHVGQTLSILAELGMSLATELTTSDGGAALADVVADSLANFTWDQELYWIGQALVMYLPPEHTSWENKFGDSFSFEALGERLMRAPPGESGPCGGTHGLYTLAVVLQAQQRYPGVISEALERNIERYMQAASMALAASQSSDGSWTKNWSTPRAVTAASVRGPTFALPEYDPIWITGHILEYQVLLPEHLRLSEARLTQAAAYILKQMAAIPTEAIQAHACAYTHGIHAIQATAYAGDRRRLIRATESDVGWEQTRRSLP